MTIVNDDEDSSIKIDTEECSYCNGNSAVRKKDGTLMTSKEWCADTGTCAATIDWDKVFHRSL